MTTATTKTPETPAAAAADPAAVVPAVEVPQTFEDAFAEATRDDDKTPEQIAAEKEAAKPAAEVVPDANADPSAAAAAAAVEADPAAAAAAAATAAAAAADPTATELAALKAENEALKLAAKGKPADPAAADPAVVVDPAKPAADEIKWYAPNDEEKALLEQHMKDWPDVVKAQAIHTKAAVYNALQYMFSEVAKNYNPIIDHLKEQVEAMEGHIALGEIRGKNQDYDTIRPQIAKWVDTLPGYVKNAAKQIMETGTPDEVSELITDYRKANPAAAAATVAAAAAAPAAPAAKQANLSPAAIKAAAKLTVVDSKRTTPAAAPDANDFEAAWKEATAAG